MLQSVIKLLELEAKIEKVQIGPEDTSKTVAGASTQSGNTEVPSYNSKIGSQFAKKKNSVSAFTGAGHKLT